nr:MULTISPECIES: hypothetical protein [unclassified Streptomyces]
MLDWHRGRLSSRRLAVLIRHMPQDSAVARAQSGEDSQWTVTDYLLAAAVDHLAAANWMFASVNTDEDADPPEAPVPVPRPGDDAPPDTDGAGPNAEPESGGSSPGPMEIARFFS